MARNIPRARRLVEPRTLFWLRPFFRLSRSRQAYVLRGVGRWIGPVLVTPRPPESPASTGSTVTE